MKYKAAVFDLDGTILNTTDDLADALNWAMEETGHKHDYTPELVKAVFGSGVTVAVERALYFENKLREIDEAEPKKGDTHEKGAEGESRETHQKGDKHENRSANEQELIDSLYLIGREPGVHPEGVDADEAARIEAVYRPHYYAHCDRLTAPYEGIVDALSELRSRGVALAVVSNKPDEAVCSLIEKHFPASFNAVIGEGSGLRRKPAPDMLLAALGKLGDSDAPLSEADCVYIGDSEIDIEASAAAGMDCISVTWGFRGRDFLDRMGASRCADTVDELLEHICGGQSAI